METSLRVCLANCFLTAAAASSCPPSEPAVTECDADQHAQRVDRMCVCVQYQVPKTSPTHAATALGATLARVALVMGSVAGMPARVCSVFASLYRVETLCDCAVA